MHIKMVQSKVDCPICNKHFQHQTPAMMQSWIRDSPLSDAIMRVIKFQKKILKLKEYFFVCIFKFCCSGNNYKDFVKPNICLCAFFFYFYPFVCEIIFDILVEK